MIGREAGESDEVDVAIGVSLFRALERDLIGKVAADEHARGSLEETEPLRGISPSAGGLETGPWPVA